MESKLNIDAVQHYLEESEPAEVILKAEAEMLEGVFQIWGRPHTDWIPSLQLLGDETELRFPINASLVALVLQHTWPKSYLTRSDISRAYWMWCIVKDLL